VRLRSFSESERAMNLDDANGIQHKDDDEHNSEHDDPSGNPGWHFNLPSHYDGFGSERTAQI
jgi:hypothetical protein